MKIEIDSALTDRVINAWLSPLGYLCFGICALLFAVWLLRYRKQRPIEEIDRTVFQIMFLISWIIDLAFLFLHFGTYAFFLCGYTLTTWHVSLFTFAFAGVFCVFINVISRFYYTKGYFADTVQAASFSLIKAADNKWVAFLLKALMVYTLIIAIYCCIKFSFAHPPDTPEGRKVIYVTFLRIGTIMGMVFGTWNLKSIYLILNGKDDLSRHPGLAGHAN